MSIEFIKQNIAQWKTSGIVKSVQVLAAPGCCDHCKAQDGKVYPLAMAAKKSPVPCPGCTQKPCRCDLLPVMEEI